jgi:RNA polymerase sigma-70 factor (ECF subfamily)
VGRDDFAEFYAATFGPLCVQLHAHTGDYAEAQDVVQEAFCRALPRWKTLAEYDDPAAWVRKVAWNLATSRWRRMRRLVDFTRAQNVDPVPPPNPDRLDLMVALAALPAPQREALVLHYIGGVSVAEIAQITGVSIGTVKSRLHRARAAMAELLTTEHLDIGSSTPPPPPPGVNQVYKTVQERRSKKTRTAAAAVVGFLCLAVLVISVRQPVHRPIDVIPTESPSESPTPTPSVLPTASPVGGAPPASPDATVTPRSTRSVSCYGLRAEVTMAYSFGEVIMQAREDSHTPDQQLCANPRVRVFWATYTIDQVGMHRLYRSQEYFLTSVGQEVTMHIQEPTVCWGGYFVVEGNGSIVQSFPSFPDPNSSQNPPYAGTKRSWDTTSTPCIAPGPTPTP